MEKTAHERISALEYWRNGNGTPGAAATIENHESRIYDIEMHHAKEEQLIIKAVKKALKEYNRNAIAYIKAFAPYFAAITAVLISIFGGK